MPRLYSKGPRIVSKAFFILSMIKYTFRSQIERNYLLKTRFWIVLIAAVLMTPMFARILIMKATSMAKYRSRFSLSPKNVINTAMAILNARPVRKINVLHVSISNRTKLFVENPFLDSANSCCFDDTNVC